MCTCTPTWICPPCVDGIDEAQAVRDGDHYDPREYRRGQDDYERLLFAGA